MSFRIHKDVKNLDRSKKCILDKLCNAQSDIQNLEVLNALSFCFKQMNDNLDKSFNASSFDRHCTPMDIDLEIFNCKKQRKICEEESKAIFLKNPHSKSLQHFRNDF